LELYLPAARSLKDKRRVLRGIKDRLHLLNVAVAEVEHQELWQRVGLAIVTVGSSRVVVEQTLEKTLDEIERRDPGAITRSDLEWLS
jgi:uncharacterized protein YlxP (DUF503 family)